MSNNNLKSKKKNNKHQNKTILFNNLLLCILLEQFPGHEQINGVRTGFVQFAVEVLQHLNCTICLQNFVSL